MLNPVKYEKKIMIETFMAELFPIVFQGTWSPCESVFYTYRDEGENCNILALHQWSD